MPKASSPSNTEPEQVTLAIADIVRDDLNLQIRDGLDDRLVSTYAEYLDDLPLVDVYDVDGLYLLIDGYHRIEAAARCNRTEIDVMLYTGKSYYDAMWDAGAANAKHGQRLNGHGKERLVINRLRAYPERSNRWVAKGIGVSKDYVERIRAKLEIAKGEERIDVYTKLLGEDGVQRPRVQAESRDAIADAIAAAPERSDREIAQQFDTSHSTVGRVRQYEAVRGALDFGADAKADEADDAAVAARLDVDQEFVARVRRHETGGTEASDASEPDESEEERHISMMGEHRVRAARLTWLENESPEYDESVLNGFLIRGDCIEVLAADQNQYDLILTDPPYGVAKGPWDFTKEEKDEFYAFTYQWCTAALARLKPSGRMFVFWTSHWWHLLRNVVEQVDEELGLGLKFSGAIIWQHNDTMRRQYTEQDVKLTYDPVLYWRGPEAKKLRFDDPWAGDECRGAIWKAVRDFGLLHSAEKPLSLLKSMIAIATYPGALVLDPFLGSGSTAVACEQTGRQWVGIDLFTGDKFDDGDTQQRYTQQRIMLEGHLKRDWREALRGSGEEGQDDGDEQEFD
jgi:site-specific DNA-methyltransferase (adenine-specific)